MFDQNFFCDTVYQGDGNHPVNLKTDPPDTSNWYHSIVSSFNTYQKYKHTMHDFAMTS